MNLGIHGVPLSETIKGKLFTGDEEEFYIVNTESPDRGRVTSRQYKVVAGETRSELTDLVSLYLANSILCVLQIPPKCN